MMKKYVAYTPREGRWPFTLANTPQQAMDNLVGAITTRRCLSIPLNNPISAVPANENEIAAAQTPTA